MREVSSEGLKLIEKFINSLYNRKLSERTLQEYHSDLKHFIGWHEYQGLDTCTNVHVFSFEQINVKELESYIKCMSNLSELKPSTINRRISTLKLFFNWAYHEKISKKNPAKHIKLIIIDKAPLRIITEDEEKNLLEAVKAHGSIRDQAIIKIMIYTGIRVSEICNLKISDIHLLKKESYIEISSSNSTRIVPINRICHTIFKKYLNSYSKASEYLFISAKTKNKLTERALRHIIKKYMDIAGLEGLSAYSLRHNFAYRNAKSIPTEELAQIMGHGNINTTISYIKNT